MGHPGQSRRRAFWDRFPPARGERINLVSHLAVVGLPRTPADVAEEIGVDLRLVETRLTIDAAGTELSVRLLGRRPARLLYLHHQSGTGDMFPEQVENLAEHGVAAPDIRGRGRSACADPSLHTWRQYADDVIAVLDRLELEQVVVVGMSFGSGVALATALRFPERVRGLVVWSTPYAGAEQGWSPEQKQTLDWTFAIAEAVVDHNGLDGIAARGAVDPSVDVERETRRWSRHDPVSFATSLLAVRYHQPFQVASELSAISTPTIVVPGTNAMHPARVGLVCASSIRDAHVTDEAGIGDALGSALARWP